MKRFIVITVLLGISVLALGVIFGPYIGSTPETQSGNTTSISNETTDEMPKASQPGDVAVPLAAMDVKIAPVFDASGAVVSDPTGTMLGETHTGDLAVPVTVEDVKVAPVFDATGAIVSDPTGTILSMAARVTMADVKIAPVFDTNGAVVSDPTGTLSSGSNP